jgi:hypothetical protein
MDQSQNDCLSARLLIVDGDGHISVTTPEEPATLAMPVRWIPGLNLSRLEPSKQILPAD